MSQSNSKKITVSFTPEHFKLVQRCADIQGVSVEAWVVRNTEGSIRTIADMNPDVIGLSNPTINKVFDAL